MVDYGKYEYIEVKKQEGVALVTLNRPEVLNAVNHKMHLELASIFKDLEEDEEVKTVVLTGAGRAFCAGGDAKWMQSMERTTVRVKKAVREARKIIEDILELEAPIIAAVNGPAVGLGATIALFCDVIIASEKAKFADPHVRMGVVAGDGGAVIWPLLVGVARAKELLMTGDIIDAREAERIGLVNRVVPAEELMPTAMNLAHRLAHGPSMAIQWTKMVINKRLKQEVNLILDNSLAWEEHTFNSEDSQEAAKAFLEKREPRFKGR